MEMFLTNDTLNKLLTTLAVSIHAFAMCEIQSGWRLVFDPMEAITIHYILKGQGRISVGDVDADYSPSHIIVVPARMSQSLAAAGNIRGATNAGANCGMLADGLVRFTAGDGSSDTLVVCATVSPSYGGAFGFFDHLRGPVVEDLSESSTLKTALDLMLSEIAAPGIGTQALTEALMKLSLTMLLRQHLSRLGTSSPLFRVLEDSRLARAVAGVLDRPSATHTVESLACLAGMSRSVFAEKFNKVFEHTPIEFVQRARLRLGAQLLQTTALPVKVIAASVGYASRSHFTRSFRDFYGIDPKAFRARAAHSDEVIQLAVPPSLGDRLTSKIEGIFDDETE